MGCPQSPQDDRETGTSLPQPAHMTVGIGFRTNK
jgi:hypothetical protein